MSSRCPKCKGGGGNKRPCRECGGLGVVFEGVPKINLGGRPPAKNSKAKGST